MNSRIMMRFSRAFGTLLIASTGILTTQAVQAEAAEEAADPAEIAIGERLFLETRFAHFYAVNGQGGDPVMDVTETRGDPLPGPFAGGAMNCAACHLVDQQLEEVRGGMRTYNDFARRSPIPAREDGLTHAPRNSPPLVNSAQARRVGTLFHFDGEFPNLHELVMATYTGRNYGWLAGEKAQAVAHFAGVIRNDDGSGELAQEFGGAYSRVLAGTDPSIPEELRLPGEFRIDVSTATDEEIFEAVTRITAAYVEDLAFSQDEAGNFDLSPYDVFLEKNGLPRQPRPQESDAHYSKRLLAALNRLEDPQYVTDADGAFQFHAQEFRFGPEELEGLRLFLTPAKGEGHRFARLRGHKPQRSEGNCVVCHPAPKFTDFSVHNTGTTQLEYDGIHGEGAFAALYIPGLRERNGDPLAWLPATEDHPSALEPFRAIPRADNAQLTDLGVWNIFANADFPLTQKTLRQMLCREERLARQETPSGHRGHPCRPAVLLERGIATFKTPGLRDLGHSAPYMHNGQFDSLDDVIAFYRQTSAMARNGELRNAAPGLAGIRLQASDTDALVAFLRSLNEDYE